MPRRVEVSSTQIVGNDSLQFLRRGIGQHPARDGPEVGQDADAWLRADPVGAEGRSLAVDYGINDALGMNNRMVGAEHGPSNMQGPQISETQRQKVLGLIRAGIDAGATVVTGGSIPMDLPMGYYVQPTLLSDVGPNARVAQEEIFGPVLCVTPYDTEDEAIGIANNSIYGLSGEVSSADEDRAARIALRMRTGSVGVNGGTFFGLTSPFGGTKQSGLGRRNGEHGFEEYLEIKTIGFPGL